MALLIIFTTLLYGSFTFFIFYKKWLFKDGSLLDKFEKYAIFIGVSLLFTYMIVSFCMLNKMYQHYPLDYDSFNVAKNPYTMLFEGFNSKHLYINIEPDERLKALSNPYQNRPSSIPVLWDYCFYNDHYYVYFGVAPVILFYYPIYILTFGNFVPTYYFMMYFCLVVSMVISTLALYRFYRHFAKSFNKLLFIILSVALLLIGGYSFLAISEPMYNLPILFATMFMYFMYYFAIKGIENKSKLFLALMGLSFILILGSRPNITLSIIPLLALLLPYLFKDFKQSIISLIPCFIILIIGFALLFLYNYLRFGNILEFGSKYQLTVSDVSKNTFHKEGIKPAFYYYFFQNTKVADPFIFSTSKKPIRDFNLGYYVYTYPTFGLFTIPAAYLILLGFFTKKIKLIIINVLTLLIVCVLVQLDFALAGVHIRYLMDILPITIFISFVSVLVFDDNLKGIFKWIYLGLICLVLLYSSFYCLEAFISERVRYDNF